MSEFVGLLMIFVPVAVIFLAANAADRQRERDEQGTAFAALAYALLLFLYFALFAAGAMLGLTGALLSNQPAAGAAAGENPLLAAANPALLGPGLAIPALLGMLLLLPAVRRAVARVLRGIDPQSTVHAVSLALSMLIVVQLVLTLGVGLATFSTVIEQTAAETGQEAVSTAGVWLQAIVFLIWAMLGVGWLVRRSTEGVTERLGLTWPTAGQAALGAGLGIAMVFVVMALEALGTVVGFGPDPDVEKLTEQLLGALFTTPFGIVTLGVAAALGEEPLFRGAAQPRFGVAVTALLFALVHSNYGITFSTAIVFLLGLVLGWVRVRHNTSTAMILHAVYNMALGLLGYLGVQFLNQ
jgi:membrane protease YdiL (CAAX protease family)